jgi:beta-lactamase class A
MYIIFRRTIMKPATLIHSPIRRNLLKSLAALPLASIVLPTYAQDDINAKFAQLESGIHGRLGVAALDSATGRTINYRADERFPLCSSFKMILAAAILKESTNNADLLSKRLQYGADVLVHHSPITEKHISDGMRIDELCAATIQYSDNAAANLLIHQLGGPKAVTAFARSIGDTTFRLDRYETMMSASVPGDVRDTSTPSAMANSLRQLTIGDALPAPQRKQLIDWMRGNTTGANRIRAGVPADWQIADKTGTGDYGTASDVAIAYPPNRAPLFIAIYTTQDKKNADIREDLLAAATRIIVAGLA